MAKVHKTIQEARKHLGESTTLIPSRYEESTSKATWEEPASSPQAEENYIAQFAPVLAAMNSAADSAPARTRDPMSNIDNRLKPVVNAAIAAKKR